MLWWWWCVVRRVAEANRPRRVVQGDRELGMAKRGTWELLTEPKCAGSRKRPSGLTIPTRVMRQRSTVDPRGCCQGILVERPYRSCGLV
ncbi:hypothetical protein FA13DRAFT_1090831 [Coprinellus micaceus]|uniref:Secreted protein n=1 Tax=Coprinellus micaceus TaxID=71717 RepID=A0A4Y7TSK9_COPMI|nr:hypothetical protein FA13DRAFT_1090831 [Coprinellus micaceus]